MALLLGGCQAGGSIWKETISLEPKDKTVSEETLDPETDIDGQVELEQVDGAELGVEMQGQDESGKLESEPGENDSNECSLLFAGDIYFSNHVLNAYDRVGGIGGVLGESLRETIAESDIFMANLEFPFSDRGTQAADKQFTFRVSPSRVSILQEIGPDIVTVANNHALDYGTDALLDTCDTLDSAGILHVGAGKNLEEAKQPQIIEKNGQYGSIRNDIEIFDFSLHQRRVVAKRLKWLWGNAILCFSHASGNKRQCRVSCSKSSHLRSPIVTGFAFSTSMQKNIRFKKS